MLRSADAAGRVAPQDGEKLIDAGFVREMKAKPTSPVWRSDEATGATYTLKLTAAGAKAVKEAEEANAASRRSKPSVEAQRAAPSPVAVRPAKTAIRNQTQIRRPVRRSGRTPSARRAPAARSPKSSPCSNARAARRSPK